MPRALQRPNRECLLCSTLQAGISYALMSAPCAIHCSARRSSPAPRLNCPLRFPLYVSLVVQQRRNTYLCCSTKQTTQVQSERVACSNMSKFQVLNLFIRHPSFLCISIEHGSSLNPDLEGEYT